MTKFNYSQIRAFNAVARASNISAAAARLGVTQPAITALIRALEKAHGVMLFERSNTGVQLTALGRRLYQETAGMESQEETIAQILTDSSELTSGELRVISGAPSLCVDLLSQFNRLYPGIRLDARFGNWGQVTAAVYERQADLAILTGPPEDDQLHSLDLLEQQLQCLVPRDHSLARRNALRFADLRAHPVIFRNGESLTQQVIDRHLEQLGVSLMPSVALESREAVIDAVAAGMGIGFMWSAASKR